jgi:hypothetical protein
MRRLLTLAVVALVILGVWLGTSFNLSFGLPGFGAGAPASAPMKATSEPASEEVAGLEDGTLRVRIDGSKIYLGSKTTTIDEVTALADQHDAKVAIERTKTAERRPREELEEALRAKNIHVVVE